VALFVAYHLLLMLCFVVGEVDDDGLGDDAEAP